MKKEIFDFIKKESIYIGIVFLVFLIIFKIAFFNENLLSLLRVVLALFWLFALPGYFIMLYWREKLGFTERFIIGFALSAAVIGSISYYLGLIGLNIKYHTFLLPLIVILIGLFVNFRKNS